MQKPIAEGTLENPVKAGAEGARRIAESLRQKDGAKVYLSTRSLFFRVAYFRQLFYFTFFTIGGLIMDEVLKVVQAINAYLSDYVLLIALIGVGIFFTIRTKAVQVRCFGEGMKNVFGGMKLNGKKEKGGMSSFQAFATAVAAQVGTGNIVGACGAILIGGPGAIFWMWVIAFFGMSTIYAEAILAQKTRKVNEDGSISGGPVYYIKEAFKGKFGKFLSIFFAVAIILALGLMGAMVQSNSISEAVTGAISSMSGGKFEVPGWVIGLIITVIAGVIFIGGVSRLASVTEKIVPIMALIYLVGGVIVLCCRITVIPEAFGMIFKYAFVPQAIIGGSVGSAIKQAVSQGAKRGLFSNEAGMGSTPHAHALANVKHPHKQGTTAMAGVFIDTFVVLTMTALIVITTLYAGGGVLGTGVNPADVGLGKSNLVQSAIASLFGDASLGLKIGGVFVAICLLFFAFSTILSWNMFGKLNFQYLFGKKATIVYSILGLGFVFLGSMLSNDLVWELTDTFNFLMVIPNVIALVALSNLVVKESKEAVARKKAKKAEAEAEVVEENSVSE